MRKRNHHFISRFFCMTWKSIWYRHFQWTFILFDKQDEQFQQKDGETEAVSPKRRKRWESYPPKVKRKESSIFKKKANERSLAPQKEKKPAPSKGASTKRERDGSSTINLTISTLLNLFQMISFQYIGKKKEQRYHPKEIKNDVFPHKEETGKSSPIQTEREESSVTRSEETVPPKSRRGRKTEHPNARGGKHILPKEWKGVSRLQQEKGTIPLPPPPPTPKKDWKVAPPRAVLSKSGGRRQ